MLCIALYWTDNNNHHCHYHYHFRIRYSKRHLITATFIPWRKLLLSLYYYCYYISILAPVESEMLRRRVVWRVRRDVAERKSLGRISSPIYLQKVARTDNTERTRSLSWRCAGINLTSTMTGAGRPSRSE